MTPSSVGAKLWIALRPNAIRFDRTQPHWRFETYSQSSCTQRCGFQSTYDDGEAESVFTQAQRSDHPLTYDDEPMTSIMSNAEFHVQQRTDQEVSKIFITSPLLK